MHKPTKSQEELAELFRAELTTVKITAINA